MGFDGWWTLLLVVAAWYVLMRWLLPGLGVPTCMSGACRTDRPAAGCTGPRREDSEESPR